MKSTFHYQQELRSTEFGTLLYNLLPKGVYVAPTLSVTASAVTMTGGTFLFYDNTANMELAVRVSYENNESVGTTSGAPAAGQYVFLNYVYNASAAAAPTLMISSIRPESTSNNTILLGVIRSVNGALMVDTTEMERRGPSYSYPNPAIASLSYDSASGNLNVTFSGFFQNNEGLAYVPALNQTGISVANAYQVYVDQTGTPQIRQTPSGSSVSMGKNILAYKEAGASVFILVPYSNRAELTADSLTISPVTPASDKTKLENIYGTENQNGAGDVILSKVVQRLVAEVQKLRSDLDALSSVVEGLGGTVEGLSNLEVDSLKLRNYATFNGTVNFSGSTVTFGSGTQFGTQSKPLSSLYVTDVLYATKLQYFS